ncbi:MAG: sigma-70 family RNA polymerase sigma factor [Planctomycetota bacterium]
MTAADPRTALTLVLRSARQGDAAARERLFQSVYDELHALAQRQLQKGGPADTMQPTMLVNEACLRLLDPKALGVEDRAHFFALAVTVMRRVLVDHYRRGAAQRRGGDHLRVTLDEQLTPGPDVGVDVLALDQALDKLAQLDARKARVVELRFFSGMSVAEVAAALEVSVRTVEADWFFARAWLRGELQGDDGG